MIFQRVSLGPYEKKNILDVADILANDSMALV